MNVTCFGQEFNPSTFAIAKADMMIRGGDPNNMRYGDTLSEDQFSGYQFQYIISIIWMINRYVLYVFIVALAIDRLIVKHHEYI